jgi:hypothetical protein
MIACCRASYGAVDAAAGHVLRSLVPADPASERAAQPSGANIMHMFVCTPLSTDIFTSPSRSAKVVSFVPLLILIAT